MRIKILASIAISIGCFLYTGSCYAAPPFTSCQTSLFQADPALQYKIIPAPGNTWGYDIIKDGKVFIHQPNRPGMPGTAGFSSKADAAKVAQLVIAKIKKGAMPPTVTPEELKALKLAP